MTEIPYGEIYFITKCDVKHGVWLDGLRLVLQESNNVCFMVKRYTIQGHSECMAFIEMATTQPYFTN